MRNICLWAIVTFALQLGSSAALGHQATEKCAGLLGCLGCCGGLAWFITANVFVFREQGVACSAFSLYNYELWLFNWRCVVAIWGIWGATMVLGCLYTCCCARKAIDSASKEVIYTDNQQTVVMMN